MSLNTDDLIKITEIVERLLIENNKKLATKKDLQDVERRLTEKINNNSAKIGENSKKIDYLIENTVKYSDIADLFEDFEEKLRMDYLDQIQCNTKDIEIIKEKIDLE